VTTWDNLRIMLAMLRSFYIAVLLIAAFVLATTFFDLPR
jgi:hypothetical protein